MLPVFVINLDRSPHRLARIGAELDRLGLAWERVAAADGAALGDDDRRRNPPSPWFRPLRPGEMGCFVSHRRVWAEILARGLPAAVVLEDDIRLADALPDALAAIEAAPPTRGFVRLMTLKPTATLPRGALGRFALAESVAFSRCSGTQGYVVTAAAARALLAGSDRWTVPVDNYMDRAWIHGVPDLLIVPSMIAEDDAIGSDIVAMSPQTPRKVRRTWPVRLAQETRRIGEWLRWAVWRIGRAFAAS